MNTYKYSAKDKNGQTINGTIQAVSEAEVADILRKKEMMVFSVEFLKISPVNLKLNDKKIKLEDLVVFSRQLATMIDAGIPLVNALSILAEQIENEGLRGIVGNVRQDIEAGMSFCDALAKHPVIFSDLFVNMVKAGEASGMLNEILDRLASFMEKQAALNRKIISSLVYPAVVVSMAIIITAVLLIKVVPTFKGIFDTLGGTLPLPTQVLIFASDLLRRYFLFLMLLLGVGIYLFKKGLKTEKGRYQFDRFTLKVPVFGPLLCKLAVAKFSRTFSTLVKSGVSVLSALEIVSKTSGNKVVEEAVINCSKSVRNGEPISRPLAKSGVFPPMVTRMINVGEQTGQLEKMLSKIADFYDDQVDAAAGALTSLIEPLVIAFLGIVIGGIVIALFLPIFKISQLMAH
ncbi:MAG: type II secretion system F family protein [Candidatus Omnitrophica bacterium]|nr:type II secretion system F family protein [Candidatus Omnitrophota bacterium]MBU4303352.1 type II secretion system F family protein [Candidatus Omnitrophota bacterium]MBU4418795.1 type II secretion system F family protein [Candidatus Omnitrophota bacterium]MBU4467584.1 type II secretion system F family protein [Candidatus Omnitrophota bacterium]MCG2707223.1 type II secretion system F family protein [Candidatus Omnitrophota bacterium]